ncbi:hypothetical protein NDU88_006169 [Pleurodeles waltl]|uniref:Uncharacterized protein n=1 Tax=Pleurodeles waltl TaxID=8319 RepID=A0AAV7TEV2_PLEWA|nr:hypothetical protein NDU88_006169 [Pleurodeles waltl]
MLVPHRRRLGGSTQAPDNVALLVAITQLRNIQDAIIGAVGTDVNLLHQDLRKAVDRITEAETKVSDIEDLLKMLQQKLDTLTVVTKEVATCVEVAEGWARCNNLWFVGLPLAVEAPPWTHF